MSTLSEKLLSAANRPSLVRDCARLIDDEVDRKSGFGGLAIKAAFKTVKAVKPGFIDGVINVLLDEWVEKLEGHYTRFVDGAKPGTFGAFVAAEASGVAERLLEVTDVRARQGEHKTVASLYQKLRPGAKEHVMTAIPGLGRVVDRYI